MIKAILFDFDGTIVTEDLLTIMAEIVGKHDLSSRIDHEFKSGVRRGLSGLIERINLLRGVTKSQIQAKLQQDAYLTPGAVELFAYLRQQGIITIVGSGNITPILEYYQEILRFDYIIGSKPTMENDTIMGISEDDFSHADYKLEESKKILSRLRITPDEVLAIGDSLSDKSRFLFAGHSIAIDPKNSIEEFASYVIDKNLLKVIPIIEMINTGQ